MVWILNHLRVGASKKKMSLPVVRLGCFDRLQCLNNKIGVAQIESSLGSELLVNGILWLFTYEFFKIRQGDVIVFRPERTDRLVELGLVRIRYRRGTLRRLPRHGQEESHPAHGDSEHTEPRPETEKCGEHALVQRSLSAAFGPQYRSTPSL